MLDQFFDEHIRLLAPEPDESEIQRRWFNAREAVVWQALSAAEKSMSYRPFPVGCATWGYKPNVHFSERWCVDKGANVKPLQDLPKVCAEITACMSAAQNGIWRIVGMAIVGSPREEDAEPVLYPCENCRRLLLKIPVVRADTHIILARPDRPDSFSDVVETTMGDIWEKFGTTPRAD